MEPSVNIEDVNDNARDCEIAEPSQEVLPDPPVKRKRRKKRKIPKMDGGSGEVPLPEPLASEELDPLAVNDAGEAEKLDVEICATNVEEKALQNAVPGEGSFSGSVLKAEEVCSKEIAVPSTSLVDEVMSGPSSSNSNTKTDILDTTVVAEKAAVNDKDKPVNTSADAVPTASTNPLPPTRNETPLPASSEVKNTPVIPRYSRFEFLANSMIITDVTTERGTVTVNEHISRINIYGSQPDCIKTSHPHLRKFCYCVRDS